MVSSFCPKILWNPHTHIQRNQIPIMKSIRTLTLSFQGFKSKSKMGPKIFWSWFWILFKHSSICMYFQFNLLLYIGNFILEYLVITKICRCNFIDVLILFYPLVKFDCIKTPVLYITGIETVIIAWRHHFRISLK